MSISEIVKLIDSGEADKLVKIKKRVPTLKPKREFSSKKSLD